jgi:hypothetical protein
MKDGPFVKFEEIFDRNPKRITKTWDVRPIAGGMPLGHVAWWAHWRRYCFFPDSDKLLDANCLWDIADFCARMTKEQKEDQVRRRAER